MKIEVDFPTNGLPEDVELMGLEMRKPKEGEMYFSGNVWCRASFSFSMTSYFVAITKPKEVWLPCTPEDACAKMLYPDSRVIRTTGMGSPVTKVWGVYQDSMQYTLEGYGVDTRASARFTCFEVLRPGESK